MPQQAGIDRYERDHLAGRLALVGAMNQYAGPMDGIYNVLRVQYRPGGQPFLPDYPSLYCSVGHSYGRGMGAVALEPIGLDVEKIRPHAPTLLDYISSGPERSIICQSADGRPDRLITTIWVIKEAVMKALGSGLSLSPRQVTILGHKDEGYQVKAVWHSCQSEWLVKTEHDRDYISAIAHHYHVTPHYWYYSTCVSSSRNGYHLG